jgi:serine/threonine-protein kinase HipA
VIDLARLLDAVIYNFLVGNNDAHGKNFSLLYHGMGTANQQIRLAPVYDVVSTTYYPELSKDMAMKIGREYSSDQVTLKDFEQLAEEAGLAKPIVRNRVPELAETVIANLDKVGLEHPGCRSSRSTDPEKLRDRPDSFPELMFRAQEKWP